MKDRETKNYLNASSFSSQTIKVNDNRERFEIQAPEHMSLINNTEETLSFFTKMIDFAQNGKNNCEIFLNFEKVQKLTIDAIMYIVALMKKLKGPVRKHCYFAGNFPSDVNANRLMMESGFSNFVRLNQPTPKPRGNYIQIKEGRQVEQLVASEVCDFASASIELEDKSLYKILIELMANSWNHAYNRKSGKYLENRWYLFVEDSGDRIRFTFLDTGFGIPATVYKKIKEKIKDLVRVPSDAYYIKSAMQQTANRTNTQLVYRGKGLPKINEIFLLGKIQNLKVISGKGYYNGCESFDLRQRLKGTLIYWEMCKNKEKKNEGITN